MKLCSKALSGSPYFVQNIVKQNKKISSVKNICSDYEKILITMSYN